MNKEAIFNRLVEVCRNILPKLKNYTFDPEDNLKALGANSLDRADILTMTVDSLSVEIPNVELFGANNLKELVDLIHEKMKQH